MAPLQRGFPKLAESGSETHFEIIRQWLASCDSNHKGLCIPFPGNGATVALPTRLLDVGDTDSPTIRLVETKELPVAEAGTDGHFSPYIALSHPWGPKPHFCTYPDDPDNPLAPHSLTQHKKSINISDLPATFYDAVLAVRALGRRYLWIDSLCILQGPRGDFKNEAKKMETVFSSAYCVLAASCASSQQDGFLHVLPGGEAQRAKRDRDVVTIQPPGRSTAVYVCEMIDRFDEHVLRSSLSRRAWVLQERALARRTVFFTERQTYFECGHGVRCETMTHMTKYALPSPPSTHQVCDADPSSSKLASFLGDPTFPSRALTGNRGEEIRWYQSLYTSYSRLDLSYDEDRPIAIRGLESRLVAALQTKYGRTFEGAYGVLNDGPTGGLLHRSLLWRRGAARGDARVLEGIVFPSGHEGAPTWSWMSCRGGIDFVQVPGDSVDWEHLDFSPPMTSWRPQQQLGVRRDGDGLHATTLIARCWDFCVDLGGGAAAGEGIGLTYDAPGMTSSRTFRCVVVGRGKAGTTQDIKKRRYFVIVVTPASSRGRGRTNAGASRDLRRYYRAGAGVLTGRFILNVDKEGEEIAIV